MGIMDLRVVITVVSFVVFLLIVLWAYSGRQKTRFDEAANLPFADDEMQQRTVDKGARHAENTVSGAHEGGQSTIRAEVGQEVPHG